MKNRTKKTLRSLAAFLLVAVMLFSLAACGKGNDSGGAGSGGGSGSVNTTGGNETGSDGNTPGDGGESQAPAYPAGKNTDNSFSMVASWTATGLINHYDSTTSCNVFSYLVVEGLWGYVRTTDEIYCRLASEMPIHEKKNMDDYKDVMGEDVYDFFKANGATEVTVTTGKIRPESKWANGDEFTAKDVWAYYYIVHPTTSNYVAAVKVVDDKTVEFIWNPLKEPVDAVKDLLLAQDINGTVKYDEFAEYADAAYELVMEGKVNEDVEQWGSFSRNVSPEQGEVLTKIRQDFYACDPDWYVATGPFMLDTFSETQLLLKKNPYHWAADKIGFDIVKLYSSKDTNQTYQMISDGLIDYYDGFIHPDTLEPMLAQNEDLINIKMFDPGAIGILFNVENPLLADIKVREALQYVFDRESVTLAANPYAVTSWYTVLGMAPSEALVNMSPEHYNELVKYSFDQDKAAQLLNDIGWEKKDGVWYANGTAVEFNLGAPTNHPVASLCAEAAAAQLNAFGIKCNLFQSDNFFSQAQEENCPYDMSCQWTDLNMSFSYPTGSYSQFNNYYARMNHLERFPSDYEDVKKRGQLTLVFDGLDGDTDTYAFADHYNKFYSVEPDRLTYMVDVFNLGISKLCLGVPFFQNVTASTYNVGQMTGLPLQELWSEDRNVTYVPQPGEDAFMAVARTNLIYAKQVNFTDGIFQPNKAE